MKVTFSVRAEKDLTDILENLAWENPATATALNSQFAQRLDQLTRLPLMGRARADIEDDLRGLLIRPYVLFYRIAADNIIVVRILHGNRDLRQILADER